MFRFQGRGIPIKWFTCIIEVPNHVQSVQYFHTRADSAAEAEANAMRWTLDGDASLEDPQERAAVDVPFVFEGRIFPEVKAE
jgi:hypothetical protein